MVAHSLLQACLQPGIGGLITPLLLYVASPVMLYSAGSHVAGPSPNLSQPLCPALEPHPPVCPLKDHGCPLLGNVSTALLWAQVYGYRHWVHRRMGTGIWVYRRMGTQVYGYRCMGTQAYGHVMTQLSSSTHTHLMSTEPPHCLYGKGSSVVAPSTTWGMH